MGRIGAAIALLLSVVLAPEVQAQKQARIVDVRIGYHTDYDRLVIELDAPADAVRSREGSAVLLEVGASPPHAQRLLMTRMRRMGQVRIQETPSGARVRIEARTRRVRAFRLESPFRIVIDFGEPGAQPFVLPDDLVALPESAAEGVELETPAEAPAPADVPPAVEPPPVEPEPEVAEPEPPVPEPAPAETPPPPPAEPEPAEPEPAEPEIAEPVVTEPEIVEQPEPAEPELATPEPELAEPEPTQEQVPAEVTEPEPLLPAATPEAAVPLIDLAPETRAPEIRPAARRGPVSRLLGRIGDADRLIVALWLAVPFLLAAAVIWVVGRSRERRVMARIVGAAGQMRTAESLTGEELLEATERIDVLEKRIDEEVRARSTLEERANRLQEDLKVVHDRLRRLARRGEPDA